VAVVGVYLLHDVSQWAGATAILACLGCFIAAALGVQFSVSAMLPGDAAFDLARVMAVVGGTSVLVAAATCTLYYWLIGVASGRAAALVGVSLAAGTLAFAGILGMMFERRRAAPR
jgi:asparagine N-glycosylation enzyme membrane subunit Stt3